MKKLLTLMLCLLMCLSFTACKDKEKTKGAKDTELTAQLEQEIRVLMEQNLDCYFVYFVSPITHTTQQNSDGYYGTDGAYFEDYNALKTLVESTYVSTKAEELLNYPSKETPLYKSVDGLIFTKPDVASFVKYNIIWEEYSVEILESSDEKCTFKLKTVDLNGKEYTVDGAAAKENDKWLFEDIVH